MNVNTVFLSLFIYLLDFKALGWKSVGHKVYLKMLGELLK